MMHGQKNINLVKFIRLKQLEYFTLSVLKDTPETFSSITGIRRTILGLKRYGI